MLGLLIAGSIVVYVISAIIYRALDQRAFNRKLERLMETGMFERGVTLKR